VTAAGSCLRQVRGRPSPGQALLLVVALGVAAIAAACTQADVDEILPYHNDKLSIDGDFCTTDPADVVYTTRILFIIDCSDSMRWNDPNGERADAIRAFIESYRDEPQVMFAIIRFGTVVKVETETFTKDEAELGAALDKMKDPADPLQFLGGTDYVGALGSALNFFIKDQVTNPQQRETNYLAVFLTDGAPQANDIDPNMTVQRILELTRAIHAMGVTLHTMMMSAEMMGVPPEFLTILQAMAAAGGGEYRELAGASTISAVLGELLNLKSILRVFDLKDFFAINLNALVAQRGDRVATFVDSDGEGLADFQEEELGTLPTEADSDGDRIGDLVEIRIGSDPLAQEQHHLDDSWFRDDDQDGLNNYEEKLLGTDSLDFDTDLDGVPDGLEVRFDTNPLKVDERGDYDEDFIPNIDEIRMHTNPRLDEAGVQVELGYSYTRQFTGRNAGRYCYHFRVDGITLRTPLAFGDQPEGLNHLVLVEVDTPVDRPNVMENQLQAGFEIVFRGPSYRDPNALTLFMEPKDFQ
jgi:Mg-chelatase subunit ChlD